MYMDMVRLRSRSKPRYAIAAWLCAATVGYLAFAGTGCERLYLGIKVRELGFDVIATNTRWRAWRSPYRIERDLLVMAGKTLRIDPGVEVVLGPGVSLRCQGRILAQGDPKKPIRFTAKDERPWGTIELFGTRTQDTEESVFRHCIVEGGKGIVCRSGSLRVESSVFRRNLSTPVRIEFSAARIVGSEFYGNSTESDPASGNGGAVVVYTDKQVVVAENDIHDNISSGGRDGGGGIFAYAYGGIGEVEIARNRVYHNKSDRFGGGIVAFESTVRDNLVFGNEAGVAGGGIFSVRGSLVGNIVQDNRAGRGGGIDAEYSTLIRNSIVSNQAPPGFGSGLAYYGEGTVEKNTIVSNGPGVPEGEAVLVSGNPTLVQNNIVRSANGYALRVQGHSEGPDVEARQNFWGVLDPRHIPALIYDWFDDPERAIADVGEPLLDWSPQAPPPPPSILRVSLRAGERRLYWEYPSGVEVSGFRLYVERSEGSTAKEGVEIPPEARSLGVPLPEGGRYRVRLTALGLGRGGTDAYVESAFSKELLVDAAGGAGEESGSEAGERMPENRSPEHKAVVPTVAPRLEAAPARSGAGYVRARWVVTEGRDDLSSPVFDSGVVGEIRSLQVPPGVLEPESTYWWRVSLEERGGRWTPWSEPTCFSTPARDASAISGAVHGDTTLGNAGIAHYRVTGNVLVEKGATLTLAPGTVLSVVPEALIRVRGRLVAQGTPQRPVVFTRDGLGEGVWGGVHIEKADGRAASRGEAETAAAAAAGEGEGSVFDHCIVEHGKGIKIKGSPTTVAHCTIRKNHESGITVNDALVRIEASTIVDNTSPGNGGGIYASGSTLIRIAGNLIEGNRAAEDGGGVFAYGSHANTAVNLAGNRILGNRCEGAGGGLWVSRSSVTGNRVAGNESGGAGGGIYATFALVRGNTIEGNSGREGGGIYAEQNSSIEGNRIVGNRAQGNVGGAAFLNFWGMSIKNEVFSDNQVMRNRTHSPHGTGGVYVTGTLVFERNSFVGNDGYQLYNANPAGSPPLVASGCYWGAASEAGINRAIYDGNDDASLAPVVLKPCASTGGR
jgi:hypothetical protein